MRVAWGQRPLPSERLHVRELNSGPVGPEFDGDTSKFERRCATQYGPSARNALTTYASFRRGPGAEHDVGGLDVALNQADPVSFPQSATDHVQDPHHARPQLGSAHGDKSLQRGAVELFHGVVEDVCLSAPVVEDGALVSG